MLQQGFSKLSAIGSKVLQRCPRRRCARLVPIPSVGVLHQTSREKTLTGQRPYISWITALWFWRQSRPCHWTEGTCLDHVTISCLECRQHLMNQLSAKSYFWGRGICRKLDPNLTHTFHTFLNFIIDIVINKHHFKNKLWLRVVNNFPHVSQSNIHSG